MSIKNLTKEKLEDYILQQKLTTVQIAELESVDKRSVLYRINKFQIPYDKNQHKKKFDDNDYIGNRYYNTVITNIEIDTLHVSGIVFVAKCDCGNTLKDYPRKFINGERKTCGKPTCQFKRELNRINGNKSSIAAFTGYEEIYGSRWASWRLGAEARNIQFDISIEYAWNVFLAQNRKCALSGIDIGFGGKWNSTDTTASLDRIDSSKPYIEGNIQWVHKKLNIMKSDMSDEQFTEWCGKVWLYRASINERSIS
jgi:hypothetical protein